MSLGVFNTDLPSSTTPPHSPRWKIGRSSGSVTSSASAVKITGRVRVPFAKILPPAVTMRQEVFASVPGLPFTTVPASMVNDAPLSTYTKPFSTYSFVPYQVVFAATEPDTCTVSAIAPCAPSRHAERQRAFKECSIDLFIDVSCLFKERCNLITPS